MNLVKHFITHQYRPSITSCSPAALSILLSHYGIDAPVDEISKQVPQVENNEGQIRGHINQQMATWCISQGFNVVLYTFDCQVIDQSWSVLPKEGILEQLDSRRHGWIVPSLGKDWTIAYAESYVDFIVERGELVIKPSATTSLLYDLLAKGPVITCVSYSTLYGKGRTRIDDEVEKTILDDIDGQAMNHTIVIYGNDDQGRFLVADPCEKPGLQVIDPERMIAAISTAQIECDNLVFQLSKR